MELFVPNILTVSPAAPVGTAERGGITPPDISAPVSSEFRKVYFEELAKSCLNRYGSLNMLEHVARIHHEEYRGAGGSKIRRWKVFFREYNVMVNLEEDSSGNISASAA